MSKRIRSAQEMVEELEQAGYAPIGIVGAKKGDDCILPGDVRIAWGVEGVWDSTVDLNIVIHAKKEKVQVD